jgi:uncharacterized membrane protein HdeD (DUF308 family)
MPEPSFTREDLQALTWAWWLLVLSGVLGVVAGVLVLAKPSNSLATLAVISGVFILVDSIFELLYAVFAEHSGVAALLGVLGVVVGILLIRHPVRGVSTIGLVIGIWLVAVGVIRLARELGAARRTWNLVVAGIEIAAGVVIVASPHIRFSTLALAVGIAFIVNGVGMAAVGWMMRAVRRAGPHLFGDEPHPVT